jgi:hypothetical protein
VNDLSRFDVNRPGNHNGNRLDLGTALLGLGFALSHGGCDRADDLFRLVRSWGWTSYALMNMAGAINVGGAQIRAAKIYGANELIFSGFINHALSFSSAKHVEPNRRD